MDAIWRTWVVVALAVTWWTVVPAVMSRAADHLGALYTGQPEAWESARPPPSHTKAHEIHRGLSIFPVLDAALLEHRVDQEMLTAQDLGACP